MRGQLEAQVHPVRTDVEQQVSGGGDGVPVIGPDLAERVQPGGAIGTAQPVPQLSPEPHHAGQRGSEVAEAHRTQQAAEIAAEVADSRLTGLAGAHGNDEENRRGGQRGGHRLRHGLRRRAAGGLRCSIQGHQRSWCSVSRVPG